MLLVFSKRIPILLVDVNSKLSYDVKILLLLFKVGFPFAIIPYAVLFDVICREFTVIVLSLESCNSIPFAFSEVYMYI